MALARVHTTNFFSPQTFEQHMKVAWSPAREVQFQHLEGNLFTIQCFCLGDWLKVDEGGPWLFRQSAVCIEKYDGLAAPETVDLNFFSTWIQIHKVPVGYRKKALITNLVEKKVGKVSEVELNVHGAGNFVRARVKLDVRLPLARFVSMSRAGQREIYQIKYEKMPRFCGACGMIGHLHLECGTGEFDEEKLKWGDWLKADWDSWHGRGIRGIRGGRTGRGGREGRGGNRDAGVGRFDTDGNRDKGVLRSWRFNAKTHTEDDLDDTATSPNKKTGINVDDRTSTDSGTKRRLALEYNNPTAEDNDGNSTLPMITDEPSSPQAQVEDSDIERNKRSKKAGADSPSLGSAGSREESVRSQ
jgi:hypothetical protein